MIGVMDHSDLLPEGWRFAGVAESEALHHVAARDTGRTGFLEVLTVIPDDVFRFECQRCGACCRDRGPKCEALSLADFRRLTEYARNHRLPAPQQRDGRYRLPYRRDGKLWACAYLKRRGGRYRCAVHSVKPLLCRTAPVGVLYEHMGRVIALAFLAARTSMCPGLRGRYPEHRIADWLRAAGFPRAIAESQADAEQLIRDGKFPLGVKE